MLLNLKRLYVQWRSFPQARVVADLLLAHGVPFVFITGYQRESIDRRYANVPVLQKPIDAAALESVLLTLLGSAPMLRAADGN
jgi:hypothetical protein